MIEEPTSSFNICYPSILYFIFTIIYTSLDLYSQRFRDAGIKITLMVLMTVILNLLCYYNYKITAYIVLFLPLLFMYYLSGIIDYFLKNDETIPEVLKTDTVAPESKTTKTTTKTTKVKSSSLAEKCGEYCLPENTCVENCYINGCYKKTDLPNTCWEKY